MRNIQINIKELLFHIFIKIPIPVILFKFTLNKRLSVASAKILFLRK